LSIEKNKAEIEYVATQERLWVPLSLVKGKPGNLLSMGGKKELYRGIQVRIIKVSTERLKNISADDAIAEGISLKEKDPIKAFSILWESCYGKNSWQKDKTKEVFVHDFELVAQPKMPEFKESWKQLSLF
jgi:hypothetical protein